jgi:hypothetical protein
VAAVVIDSPRWRDGWGESQRFAPTPERPALRLVDGGAGDRRPATVVVRRRRLLVVVAAGLLLAIALGVASVVLTRPATAGASAASAESVRRTHLVEAGDTYWSIAEAVTPEGTDLRIAVDALIDANGGRELFPGDRIELP